MQRTAPLSLLPKSVRCFTISKEKEHKVRTEKETIQAKRNSAEVREEAKRTRKWKKARMNLLHYIQLSF